MKEVKRKTIYDYDECPHCGSGFGYYMRISVHGEIRDRRLFEDREPYNAEMYDHIVHRVVSKYWHCDDCNKKICKATSNDHEKI